MLLNQALTPPAFWYVSVSPGRTLVSDWTFGIIARIGLITELFWAENVGLGYFPQLIFGVNRAESVTAAPNTHPRLQLSSLEEQLQLPGGIFFEVGSLGLSDLCDSVPPSLRILEEWGSLLAGTGCASPLADGPWGCSQLAALGPPIAFPERCWGWHGPSSRIDELLLAPLGSPFPSSLPNPSWVQLRIWPKVWF